MTDELTDRLRALPELAPPADAWVRIAARVDRDGSRRRLHSAMPVIAVTGLLACVLIWVDRLRPSSGPNSSPVSTAVYGQDSARDDLDRLRAHSRALEAQLRGLPARPRSVDAQTAAVIGRLEDHIAVLDHQLMRPGNQPSRFIEGPIWQQRVSLMNELVRARYREIDAKAL